MEARKLAVKQAIKHLDKASSLLSKVGCVDNVPSLVHRIENVKRSVRLVYMDWEPADKQTPLEEKDSEQSTQEGAQESTASR